MSETTKIPDKWIINDLTNQLSLNSLLSDNDYDCLLYQVTNS